MTASSCVYSYDPLDRLVSAASASEPPSQRFYQGQCLNTEICGATYTCLFNYADQPLAQRNNEHTLLLAANVQRSVLSSNKQTHQGYSPYGQRTVFNGFGTLLGFNGEQPDPVTGHYVLGNGYRAYNPVLMRFNSSDNLSPFDKGGINSFAYCLGDPVNRTDPSGHFPLLGWLGRIALSRRKKAAGQKNFEALSDVAPLVNRKPNVLEYEKYLARWALKNNVAEVFEVTAKADALRLLKSKDYYKFIYTDQNELFVGRIAKSIDTKNLSHPALAAYARSSNVISAGYMSIVAGRVRVINNSGHYHPDFYRLSFVKSRLEALGINASRIRKGSVQSFLLK